MIYSAECIAQPTSGKYVEKIYDIQSPWNSSNWTWIKFIDENGEWCGEFTDRRIYNRRFNVYLCYIRRKKYEEK